MVFSMGWLRMSLLIVHQCMTNTCRALAALVLAGAAMATAGTAHADDFGDRGGQSRGNANSTVVDPGGDSFLGETENRLAPVTRLLGLNGS